MDHRRIAVPEEEVPTGYCHRGHPKIRATTLTARGDEGKCGPCQVIQRRAREQGWSDDLDRIQRESDALWIREVYPHPWEQKNRTQVIVEEYLWLSSQIGPDLAQARLMEVYRVTPKTIARALQRVSHVRTTEGA